MSMPLLWKHLIQLQSAPMTAITLAAAGSFLGQIAAVIQGAPLWVYVVAAVAPWLPIFVLELSWTYRHYKWVAVFCLLLVSQAAYLFEHTAQMVQLHVLGRRSPRRRACSARSAWRACSSCGRPGRCWRCCC
jgi:hypothetical protein